MHKRKVLKNRNGELEQPQQQEQHMGQGKQQSMPTNKLQQQPPRIMTITVKKGGQPREYHYQTTVNSFEELDKYRFQNYCTFTGAKHKIITYMSITIPCTRKKSGNCDFELRAYRSSNDGNIDVYAYSQHNHPFLSDVKRLLCTVGKDLVPDGNPRSIFRTSDNIEWSFLQTLPHYDILDKFRRKNNSRWPAGCDRNTRIRGYCIRRSTHQCKFMLLVVKTTKQRYHAYSYGEHNHPVHKIKRRQKSARGKQNTRQEEMEDEDEEGEVPMEEEQENEPIDEEQHPEDIAQPEQDEQMATDEGQEYPLEKCQRRLKKNLSKDNKERTKKWMGRIDRTEIGQVIIELDVRNVANLLSMAKVDICRGETSLDFWLPWIKKAIRKKASQKREAELVKFIMKFKHLRKIESLPDKLKGKIRKMLDKRRLEIEAQKEMVPEETSSDDEN